MVTNHSRRALLVSVGAASLAGCLGIFDDPPTGERPADGLPDNCPLSTLSDYDPPDDLSRDAVETFVIEYHEAYVLNEMFSPHEKNFVGASVASIDRHEYGYVVVVTWEGANYSDTISLEAEPATDSPESDLPSVETLDSKILRELAIEAADQDDKVWRFGGYNWDSDQRQELESLPGNGNSRYVSVDGTPVRLMFWLEEMHDDVFDMSTRYYVDSHVVRQSDEHMGSDEDADPRRLPLLECRS